MIRLENVTKVYPGSAGPVSVLKGIDLTVGKGERIGILGRNGAGKSTLIRLVSGSERPTRGRIHRQMSVSWPLAFGGAFLGRLTGYDNFRFVCRLYDVDPDSKVEFVQDFSELGRYFREPLRTYSAGMRARLAFAVSMAVEFDCFLIDEIIAVGDSRFQAKCHEELFVKRADRALLIVSHHADFVREYCTSASVLEAGVLRSFPSVDAAYEVYSAQQAFGLHPVAMPDLPNGMAEQDDDGAREPTSRDGLMEERAEGLAQIMLSLPDNSGETGVLTAMIRAMVGEFGHFGTALRVIDTLKARGAPDLAVRLWEVLAQFHGGNSLYHVVLGDLWQRRDRVPDAISAYRQAIALESTSFWGQRNLAMLLFDIGCYSEARPVFERAAGLTTAEPLRREILRHLIDCSTYLDEPVPPGLLALAPLPGDSIEDVTAVYYSGLGLLSVRVQGYVRIRLAERPLMLIFDVGGERHKLSVQGPGANSLRRHAALSGGDSFAAELVVRIASPPAPVSVRLLAGETLLASHAPVAVGDDPRALAEGSDPDAGPAAMAALSSAAHDPQACVVHARLAEAEGQEIDREAVAEAFLSLGRYHDAEHLLTKGPLQLLGGRLFDMLCVEIARSRLPGWQRRIQDLVDTRLAHDGCDVSGLTNQGHLHVAAGRVPAAIASYDAAARVAGDADIIHFNRGIAAVRHARLEDRPALPTAAQPPAEPEGIVHLFSCDAVYFKRYGPAVIASSRTMAGAERVLLHVHIVDPDLEALDLARDLQERHEFHLTTEFFPFPDAPRQVRIAYYTAARFLIVPRLLALYRRPILITEADCRIRWQWDNIIQWCRGADFGAMQSALFNFVPWTRIPAGIIYFDCGATGAAMARDIHDFLHRVFNDRSSHGSNLWTIDQVALWLAWERYREHITSVHLPMYAMLMLATGDKTNIL